MIARFLFLVKNGPKRRSGPLLALAWRGVGASWAVFGTEPGSQEASGALRDRFLDVFWMIF